jgi:hypothetical protein
MPDYILIDGDQAIFMPSFGAATVVVQPGKITGSGPMTLTGTKVCIDGDEASVEVAGCTYVAGGYVIPGTGTLKIDALAGDQLASKTNTGSKAVLLVGSTFTAKFEVQSPAQQPAPPSSPVPDSTPSYSGTGNFVTTNTKFRGS